MANFEFWLFRTWLARKYLAFLASVFVLCAPVNAEYHSVNIVLIMADDVGFECFGSYGSKEYHTPRLDRLAAKGIRFANCHSTPLCTPSRVNLMSGKSNVFNYQDFGVYPKGEPTFAHYFKSSGYTTTVAGKWQLLTEKHGTTPVEAGFDTWCVWNYPGYGRKRYWDPSLNCNGSPLELPKGSYGPDVIADFAIDFIEANKDRPFLLYYPMMLPHNPFLPTPDSVDRDETDEKKNFIDMVAYMDKCVGRVIDALDANGLRDNTLVLFTGDNGTNQIITSELRGKQIRGAKGCTRDHGTHVPLIVNWPGRIPPGQSNNDLICFSDFFPTIVEAAGLKAKKTVDGDGWSFWPQCLGKPGKKHEWIYGYYFPRPYAKKLDNMFYHWEVRYARNKRFKLYDNGKLYNTVEDVLEKHPIAPDTASKQAQAVQEKLQSTLDAYPEQGLGIDYTKVRVNDTTRATPVKK